MAQTDKPPEHFAKAVCDELRAACDHTLLAHPELRTITVILGWQPQLLDEKLPTGMWLCPSGGVSKPADLFGSIVQTIRVLDEQFAKVDDVRRQAENNLILITQELQRHYEAVKKAKETGRESVAETGEKQTE